MRVRRYDLDRAISIASIVYVRTSVGMYVEVSKNALKRGLGARRHDERIFEIELSDSGTLLIG